MHAIRINRTGGPEELEYQEIPVPVPGKDEALVRVQLSGVNYIDVYDRTGRYPKPLPFTPGVEGVGIVEQVGSDVREVRPGRRVGWVMFTGSYAEYAVVPAWRLVPIPDGVSDDAAAAAMLQGATAQYLVTTTYPVQPGDDVLIHAAAGGTGLLVTQLAVRRGARVIGTVSTPEKAALARSAGAHDTILYTQQDFVEETRRLTGGRGVAVVYDSVGRTTFDGSLNCLRPRGMLVLFGGSSGAVPPFDPITLSAKGSLYLTRPTLAHYIADRPALLSRMGDVFAWLADGSLRLLAVQRYPLKEAARAHEALEARKTTGKVLLG